MNKGSGRRRRIPKILDHRGWQAISHLFPLAHLGLARCGLQGDPAKARRLIGSACVVERRRRGLRILIEAREYEKLKERV
jgi:hypothetical protein